MVEEASKPLVSEEEEKYREELFPDIKKITSKNLLCTSCNSSVKQLVLKGKLRCHTFLETLLCEKCFDFYGDGEFSVDEDGSDKYCRWCGQGGTLYLCSTCTAGFCKKCIKRNLPRAVLKDVEGDEWQCFCCNVEPLYELRAHCWAASEYVKTTVKGKSDASSKKKRDRRTRHDSDEEVEETSRSKRSRKSRYTEEDEDSVDSSGKKKAGSSAGNESSDDDDPSGKKDPAKMKIKEFKLARTTMANVLTDLANLNEVSQNKANNYRKNKVTASKVHDLPSFNKTSQNLLNMMESMEKMIQKLRSHYTEFVQNFEITVNKLDEENGVDQESHDAPDAEENTACDSDLKTEKEADEGEAENGDAAAPTENEVNNDNDNDMETSAEPAEDDNKEEESPEMDSSIN